MTTPSKPAAILRPLLIVASTITSSALYARELQITSVVDGSTADGEFVVRDAIVEARGVNFVREVRKQLGATEISAVLDGATGNVFNVDLNAKTFELLKQTEDAPQSDIGKSRFKIHWNDETRINEVTESSSFAGIKEPVMAERDGQFVAKGIQVAALEDPRATDDPNLPRVLVIGDSISMNYHEAAKAALKGIANYHRNEGNSFSSVHGVSNAELWLGNYQEKGLHWDVIHFNHGLHDLKQAYDQKTDTFGEYAVPIELYKQSLEKEIAILKKTGATLIWCSTTPIPQDNKSQYARRKGSEDLYNQAARVVMQRHPDILTNDLHGVVARSPVFDSWRQGTDVHFYKPDERKLLGEAVAGLVLEALETKEN